MVIRIHDIVLSADTSEQGSAVFACLQPALLPGDDVTLSFEGVKTVTSSFVNTAFVQLLETMSLADIKRRLRIVSSTRQINDMIRRRLRFENDRSIAAA